MDHHTSYIMIGASCGAAIVAGSYFLFMGSRKRKDEGSDGKDGSAARNRKNSVEDDEKFPAGRLNIYFGSQTGTAAGFARTLAKEGIERGFKARDIDLEDFQASDLATCKVAIFLMATYGEGEPTDNATSFSSWMHDEEKQVTPDFLQDVSFTVFGLGNRQYENFNKMGKRTNDAMERFGGKRVFEYGEGDDDGTLEDDFQAWKIKLWPALVSQFHKNAAGVESSISSKESKVKLQYKVVPVTKDHDKVALARQSSASVNSTNKHFFTAPLASISVNRELRVNGGPGATVGSTRHVEIDLAGTGLTYHTADNLAVLPENDPIAVAELAKALDYSLDQSFYVEHINDAQDNGSGSAGAQAKFDFPSPCTVKDALTRFFDLHGVVKHSTLSQLLPYVTDATQQAWLRSLLSEENRAAFKAFVVDGGKTLCHLLINGGELSSCKIPLADFLHVLPFLQPRYYTISSSSSCYPNTVHITVSITEFAVANGSRKLKGVCSGYLQRLLPGSASPAAACRVFVRPSTFRLPKQLSTPIVMIGPGTGVAPMRALLQDRRWQAEQGSNGSGGKNTLYFGCQKSTVDFIYKDEIEAMATSKVISHLHLAFSREQEKKVYVQHLISRPENAQALMSDLDQGGYIYVCGATGMGVDVMEAIVKVIMEQKTLKKEAAVEFVKDLQKKGRYVQELWTA